MSTQGMVTVKSGNRVVMKIVAGSNGGKALILSERIKTGWPVSADDAYRLAQQCGFGSQDCLVVITATEVVFKGDGDLNHLYRDTFDQPQFNPRWEQGTIGELMIVNV